MADVRRCWLITEAHPAISVPGDVIDADEYILTQHRLWIVARVDLMIYRLANSLGAYRIVRADRWEGR